MLMRTHHRPDCLPLELTLGLVPQRDDGGVLALDHDRDAVKHVGVRVVLEGTRSRFDPSTTMWTRQAGKSKPQRQPTDLHLELSARVALSAPYDCEGCGQKLAEKR